MQFKKIACFPFQVFNQKEISKWELLTVTLMCALFSGKGAGFFPLSFLFENAAMQCWTVAGPDQRESC